MNDIIDNVIDIRKFLGNKNGDFSDEELTNIVRHFIDWGFLRNPNGMIGLYRPCENFKNAMALLFEAKIAVAYYLKKTTNEVNNITLSRWMHIITSIAFAKDHRFRTIYNNYFDGDYSILPKDLYDDYKSDWKKHWRARFFG